MINEIHHDIQGSFTSVKVDLMHRKIYTFEVYPFLSAYDPAHSKDAADLALSSCGNTRLDLHASKHSTVYPQGESILMSSTALIVNALNFFQELHRKVHIEFPHAAGAT